MCKQLLQYTAIYLVVTCISRDIDLILLGTSMSGAWLDHLLKRKLYNSLSLSLYISILFFPLQWAQVVEFWLTNLFAQAPSAHSYLALPTWLEQRDSPHMVMKTGSQSCKGLACHTISREMLGTDAANKCSISQIDPGHLCRFLPQHGPKYNCSRQVAVLLWGAPGS